eukprot:9489473-Pyramimonas_sp.AAC.1
MEPVPPQPDVRVKFGSSGWVGVVWQVVSVSARRRATSACPCAPSSTAASFALGPRVRRGCPKCQDQ